MSTGIDLVRMYLQALARGPGLHTICDEDLGHIEYLMMMGTALDKRSPSWAKQNERNSAKGDTGPRAPAMDDYGSAIDVAQSPAVVATVGEDVVTGEEMPDAIVDEGDTESGVSWAEERETGEREETANANGQVIETAPPQTEGLVRARPPVNAGRPVNPGVQVLPTPHPGAPQYG